MKVKKKIVLLMLLPIVIGIVIYWYAESWVGMVKDEIDVSGNIEVTDVAVSFRISGWVEERLVDEGETVSAGQIIARLESTELAQEVLLYRAEVNAARAVFEELETGYRTEEIEEWEAVVRRTRVDLDRLAADYKRQERLYAEKVISTSEFDAAKADYDAEEARYREVNKRLVLFEKGPRKEKIDKARADLQRARAALRLAKTRLGYTTIKSSISGIVLSKNVEPGEYVSPGTPVVIIGNLNDIWLRAYINETDLGRIKVGQKVHITTDTYPEKIYEGHVSFIASEAEFTPKNVQTKEERVKLVYRIKIVVYNPEMELKPGMPADGKILLKTE
ncbi:efflux RND transporter periplasmic adaptor subunit [uncultured Candidatus Kuenenia sp.]|jgi:HlyD family secretion protein|uniref:HlyD family secretion protein n=1 Tax=uncultured Candidatus Kuenenia sp. TaxID=1048336 RepID=UPI00030ED01A|nr:efflux RND transporter periplasmic adaptor subunit [uncultured Candidatus Kuenenia sp.]